LDKASKSDYVITIIPDTAQIFDSDSHVLYVANASAGRAFLGHRVGSDNRHESRELAGSGVLRHLLNETDEAQSRSWDVEEFINVDGDIFPSRGSLDAASVEVEGVEVRDGDSFSCSLLMLPGPHWLGTRRCKLSADGCESRVSLLRLGNLPWVGAGRKILSSTFPGKTIEVSVWAGCTR